MNNVFNVSCRKVGGITFLKVGRFNVSWSVSKYYRPIGQPLACSGPAWDALEERARQWRASRVDADTFDMSRGNEDMGGAYREH